MDGLSPEERWNRTIKNELLNKTRFSISAERLYLSGMQLPKKLWCLLTEMGIGHGRCRNMKYKWGLSSSPECDGVLDKG